MQDNGTTLPHMKHNLIVYKIDHKKFDKDTQMNYLALPSFVYELSKQPKPSVVGLQLSGKDLFTIETNLCSTKLTQDGNNFVFSFNCFFFCYKQFNFLQWIYWDC